MRKPYDNAHPSGGDSVPVGTFHGKDSVPVGTFHGGDTVPTGTFH